MNFLWARLRFEEKNKTNGQYLIKECHDFFYQQTVFVEELFDWWAIRSGSLILRQNSESETIWLLDLAGRRK